MKRFSLLKEIVKIMIISSLMLLTVGQGFADEFPYAIDGKGLGASQGLEVVQDNLPDGIQSETSVKNLVLDWVKYFLQFYSLVAVGIVMYLGVSLIFAREDEKKRNDIVKAIINLAIGTMLIYLSYAIVNTIVNLVTPADMQRQAQEIKTTNP